MPLTVLEILALTGKIIQVQKVVLQVLIVLLQKAQKEIALLQV